MAFSPADSAIFSTLFSSTDVAEIFSDTRYVMYLLQVEAELAQCQERLGIIPVGAGQVIAEAAHGLVSDFEQLRAGTEKAGLPIINLVQQLRAEVGKRSPDNHAASFVHWGATTQDIMDTALVLQLRDALRVIEDQLARLVARLSTLADQHRDTVMAGRTHSQQALPITFGLKVAGWLEPLLRHQQRLDQLRPRLFVVQFGGASGTLASLQPNGAAVVDALAAALDLSTPLLPWHTQRDNLAECASWLSLVSGSLAKMAQDIILMAQSEIGEVRESADVSRGGSSTMPQKSNPVISEVIIAAARTNASLLASMHQAMIHEHERATHSWQMEWLSLPQMVGLTAAALDKACFLSDNIVINQERMQANIVASNGLMLAEAINFALADHMPRAEAKKLVSAAVQVVLAEDRHLVDVVRDMVDYPIEWENLKDERIYLGDAEEFINRVIEAAGRS